MFMHRSGQSPEEKATALPTDTAKQRPLCFERWRLESTGCGQHLHVNHELLLQERTQISPFKPKK
jgi:hypothetical protein